MTGADDLTSGRDTERGSPLEPVEEEGAASRKKKKKRIATKMKKAEAAAEQAASSARDVEATAFVQRVIGRAVTMAEPAHCWPQKTGGHLEQAERDGVAALFASRVISRAVEGSGSSESPGAQCS